MKQRITEEQLNELTEDEKEKLCDWWNPEESDWVLGGRFGPNTICDVKNKTSEITICMECVDYSTKNNYLPLFSIGQCIDFIKKHNFEFSIGFNDFGNFWVVQFAEKTIENLKYFHGEELIDALWEAVKEGL